MTDQPTPRHYQEELQDLLDNRLAATTRAEVGRHLETCVECQRQLDALRWTKQFAGRFFPVTEAPAELREKILRELRPPSEDRSQKSEVRSLTSDLRPPTSDAPAPAPAPTPHWWNFRPDLRPYFAAAAAVAVIAIAALLFWPGSPRLPEVVARDFRAFRTQKLALELSTGDVKQMEAYFAQRGLTFNTRVFDLAMMNYRLEGGRVEPSRRQPRAQFVYRGPANQSLLCQMFVGRVAELPAGAVARENKGIQFHVYETNGLTAVFWQEAAVVCALISDIPKEEVVQLAFAKAMN